MPKRITQVVGLLILALFLAAFLLQVGGSGSLLGARAAHPETTFTVPYNISNSPDPVGGKNRSQRVQAARAGDGYLHAAWMEGTEDQHENGPAYTRGQGSSWSLWEWAGPNNNLGYTNPDIALDSGGTAHLVWAGGGDAPYEIYYASKPAGGNWSAPVNLSQDAENNSIYPAIAIDNQGRIWVVWETELSPTDFEVYATNKPAGGSWSNVANISNRAGQDLEPDIVVDAGNVPYVAWRNNAGSVWDIYLTRYSGGTWVAPLNLSNNSSDSHFPRLAADAYGDVFVVWEDEIDGADRFQVLFRRWDGGLWGTTRRVSSTPSKALYPAIAADHCNLYVVWTDDRNTSTETYFSHSTDCGNTWLGDENASNNPSASQHPDVVAQAGGAAHIFWEDLALGQYDIFYSKATTQVPPPTPTPTRGTWYAYLPVLPAGYAEFDGAWEVEPNDFFGQANGPLISGQDLGGWPDDDDDYFYFTTAGGGTMVQMWNYAPGIYGQMFLYNGNEEQVAWDNDPFDGWLISLVNLPAGTYYVRIYTDPGGQTDQQIYTLRATFP